MNISKLLLLFTLLLIQGCAGFGNPEPYVDANGNPLIDADGNVMIPRSVLDRVEFDEDEYGCVDLRGQIDLNPAPMFTSNANIVLKKTKVGPNGEIPPEC